MEFARGGLLYARDADSAISPASLTKVMTLHLALKAVEAGRIGLDEAFEIGAFSAEPGRAGYTAASVLKLERQRLKSGRQTVTLVLEQVPRFVGIDPFNTRIDRNSEDNLARVDQ